MMSLKSVMLVMVLTTAVFWCCVHAADVKCTGDALSIAKTGKIDNNDTCLLACGPNEKCYCDDTSASKSFKSCNQGCRPLKMPNNETIQECPKMDCKGFDTCYQGCFGTNCPDTYCKSRKRCTQECPGQCTKLVCSSPECMQQCFNCTMECTSEVKKCVQFCQGGHCTAICHKNSDCSKCGTYSNPATKCTAVIKDVQTTTAPKATFSSHADQASASFFFNLIALLLFVKNIA